MLHLSTVHNNRIMAERCISTVCTKVSESYGPYSCFIFETKQILRKCGTVVERISFWVILKNRKPYGIKCSATQGTPWGNRSRIGQQINRILWYTKFHYRVKEKQPFVPNLSQINPVHTLPSPHSPQSTHSPVHTLPNPHSPQSTLSYPLSQIHFSIIHHQYLGRAVA